MLDPEQRYQIGVTAGLRDHARAGIHQDDRQIRRGTTRDHIPGVLLVPRGVGDDELTVVRAEITVSHIDRDTLLTLGLHATAIGLSRSICHHPPSRRSRISAGPSARPYLGIPLYLILYLPCLFCVKNTLPVSSAPY